MTYQTKYSCDQFNQWELQAQRNFQNYVIRCKFQVKWNISECFSLSVLLW